MWALTTEYKHLYRSKNTILLDQVLAPPETMYRFNYEVLSAEEICVTVDQLRENKAPGPSGIKIDKVRK